MGECNKYVEGQIVRPIGYEGRWFKVNDIKHNGDTYIYRLKSLEAFKKQMIEIPEDGLIAFKPLNYCQDKTNTQAHYKGKDSLYKFCEEWGLNAYEFDILKRVVRCRHKGEFKKDLEKTKDLIDIYLTEHEQGRS